MNQHSAPTFQKPSLGRRMITLLLSAGTAAVVLGSSIPADAWAADETRAVSGFQAVALEGSTTVKVELADTESVRVNAEGKGAESVETVVEDRKGVPTLVIRQTGGWFNRKAAAVVTVNVKGPAFKALGVAGSGQLEARLSNQPSLLLLMAGSGDLRVQGLIAHQVEVNVAGSGDAWLKDLEAEDVKVSVAGSGDARVQARQRLRVSVAGSGDVRYSGAAKDISTTVLGSGTVKRE